MPSVKVSFESLVVTFKYDICCKITATYDFLDTINNVFSLIFLGYEV